MAIPTVSTIIGDEGVATGGYLIEFLGTGFLVAVDPLTLPGPYPFPIPEPAPTVTIQFHNVAGFDRFSPEVTVVSDTRMFALVPKALLSLDSNGNTVALMLADITIRNVDTSGVPIPTEEVTLPDAFTYRHVNLAGTNFQPTTIVTEHLMAVLRSEVLANTSSVPHTEFDGDLGTAFVDAAQLPQMVALGPNLTPSEGLRYLRDPVETQVGGSPEEYRQSEAADYVDLSFKLIGMSNFHIELSNLAAVLTKVIYRNPILRPPRDLMLPDGETIDLDMEWVTLPNQQQLTGQFGSNLRYFQAELIIKGLPLSTIDTLLEDSTREQGTNLGDALPEITTTGHPDND